MAMSEHSRRAADGFSALDRSVDVREKLEKLLKIERMVLVEDPSYRCIEESLQKFLSLRHDTTNHVSLRRYLAYLLEQVAIRKPKMALRCVPACISLLEDPDPIVRQLVIQSARTLQSRALLLIAKASPQQYNNVDAATQALTQLQDRIWQALEMNMGTDQGVFHQAAMFGAHHIIITTSSSVFVRPNVSAEVRGVASIEDIPQNEFLPVHKLTERAQHRLQEFINLFDSCLEAPKHAETPDHITSLLEAFGCIGKVRPHFLPKILGYFRKLVGGDPWLDNLLAYHIRMFLACALAGDHHATCVEILKQIDAGTGAVPMENLIAASRHEMLTHEREEVKKNEGKLLKPTLSLMYDGDALLGTEVVVAANETYDDEHGGKFVEPFTLMTLRLNPKDAARICLTGIENGVQKIIQDPQNFRVVKDLTEAENAGAGAHGAPTGAAGVGGAAGQGGTKKRPAVGPAGDNRDITPEMFMQDGSSEVVDPRARKRQKIQEEQYKDTTVVSLEDNPGQVDDLQKTVFDEVIRAKSRLQQCLHAQPDALSAFDDMNNRVIALLASFVTDKHIEERFFTKAIQKALDNAAAKNYPPLWYSGIITLFYAKYSSTVQRNRLDKRPLKVALENDVEFSYERLFNVFLQMYNRQSKNQIRKDLREIYGQLPYLPESLFQKLENQMMNDSTRKNALLTCLLVVEKFPSLRAQGMRLLFKMAYSHYAGNDLEDENADSVHRTATRFLAGKVYVPAETQQQVQGRVISMDVLRTKDIEDFATLMLRSVVGHKRFEHQVQPSPYIMEIYAQTLTSQHLVPETYRHWLFLAMAIKKPRLTSMLIEVFSLAIESGLDDIKNGLLNTIVKAVEHFRILEDPDHCQQVLEVIESATNPRSVELLVRIMDILLDRILVQYDARKEENKAQQPQQLAEVLKNVGPPNLPQQYKDVVVKKYETLALNGKNPQLLLSVIGLMPRAECLKYLVDILNSDMITQDHIKFLMKHLVRTASHAQILSDNNFVGISVPELITEIHHFNTTAEDQVTTSKAIQALNAIFDLMTKEGQVEERSYHLALQSLAEEEEKSPVPTLLMRTLLQLMRHLASMTDIIAQEILPQVVRKPIIYVEKHKRLFEGLKYIFKQAFELPEKDVTCKSLALVPQLHLEDLLAQFPEWKDHLASYTTRQPAHLIPSHVRSLVT